MSQNPQPPEMDILKTLVGNLKVQLFTFALATIMALSLFGARILRDFIPLVYIVVVGAPAHVHPTFARLGF